MTTVFVDLVNLDGSRPEGALRFSLERLVLGDPDVVPSAVEVKIRDGRARVDDLLPGVMRVRVNAGCWSKDWHIEVPESGEHDLFDLLEWQADDFQETVWAELNRRVEKLENTPPVDLAPVEQRLDALESRPEPQPFDPTGLEAADKKLGERVTALENQPAPQPFDPAELQAENAALKTQVEQLQAHLKPAYPGYDEELGEALNAIYDTGAQMELLQQAGRVEISIRVTISIEDTLRALDDLQLPNLPVSSAMKGGGFSYCDVSFYDGAKFLTTLEPATICLVGDRGGTRPLRFEVAVDAALQVAQEVGANRMFLSTYYYTTDQPPADD